MKKWIYIAVAVIAALALFFFLSKGKQNKKISFATEQVNRTSISTSVTATGTLEAVTTVTVGTQVSGIVNKLYVDYNTVVKKGQVIAELDRTNLESDLASQQANLRSAQSELEYQQKNYARYAELNEKQLVSRSEYDVALQSLRKAQEQVKVAQQNVQKARTNLGYATIYSPIDGVVISKEVEVGQTVASSFNTPTLFTIAKDLSDMRVIANVDEADIGSVREGQRVTFLVDAYPDDVFNGSVTQVRQKATTTNNVVTYQVVISAPNTDLKLKPGLTANVTIYTLEVNDALAVSNKALRFTPEPQIVGEEYIIEDVESEHKLWTLDGKTFKAHAVTTGMTDGIHTAITGGIDEGTTVVTDVNFNEAGDDKSASGGSPFMPGPRNRKTDSNSKK